LGTRSVDEAKYWRYSGARDYEDMRGLDRDREDVVMGG